MHPFTRKSNKLTSMSSEKGWQGVGNNSILIDVGLVSRPRLSRFSFLRNLTWFPWSFPLYLVLENASKFHHTKAEKPFFTHANFYRKDEKKNSDDLSFQWYRAYKNGPDFIVENTKSFVNYSYVGSIMWYWNPCWEVSAN